MSLSIDFRNKSLYMRLVVNSLGAKMKAANKLDDGAII